MYFPLLEKEVDCRDACMLIHAHMFAKVDGDMDLHLNRCEWSYACMAASYEKGDGEKEHHKKGTACVKMAHKHIPAGKGASLKNMAEACAHEYKTTYCPA